jgi:4-alpha-glucanotransferase
MKKANRQKPNTNKKITDVLQDEKRSAGVLLHITSLPSPFGIGDFGPEALKFVDFLKSNYQAYWQILPLTTTESSQSYSPYSATSCMAGNILLISPELLVNDKLLTRSTINKYKISSSNKVNFTKAFQIKNDLLEIAYRNFQKLNHDQLHSAFEEFMVQETYWLNDYALYAVLKKHHNQNPWYAWPDKLKFRDAKSLEQFTSDEHDQLQKEKWLQYIFFKQWHELKQHAHNKNIKLFGDLPFYVSYDSADVWAKPEYFSLNKKGQMEGVAGVPPDYFNDNGQLWGMPVFRWDALKKNNYDWWICRIRKNMELYDLLRFDHFRAFANYWDVPAGERTAKFGKWKEGPGNDFFNEIKKEFPTMPFVAEDLGDIDDTVHELRDRFNLPGMKVLQFGFGENMPISDHIPHNFKSNFVVYTGTHDNNTTRGWYKENTDSIVQKNINGYFGKVITPNNVHLELIRQAYASVARLAIIPMQDMLGLDEKARINMPASTANNWQWRLKSDQLKKIPATFKEWIVLFNRK